MPSRKTTKAALAAAGKLPTIPKELIDQFVKGPTSAEAVQADVDTISWVFCALPAGNRA